MTRAYGGCIGPGGLELDDERSTTPCPHCGGNASAWRIERVEGGSLNLYIGLSCSSCGHAQGDDPRDDD